MANLQFFTSLKVAGNCNLCKIRIETKLWSVKGVSSAEWDQASQILKIQYDHEIITLKAIKMIMLKLGHDIDGALAPDAAYKKLPLSCRYRSINHN